ncbi:hypothetical protein [Coleofasciculus sp. FACHB-1120]|uniref:hypothetical protein n=1 Tax=Coleofasciculus sp. FACHB-1120 TaxID=2692783 RepID=UPI0016860779|nr:hypothetical protein [Coleofasciculus sp. FACHB-1120]MBD2741228.1 hypothetical protein [Coleofasciculus sp. FACHB-1120]
MPDEPIFNINEEMYETLLEFQQQIEEGEVESSAETTQEQLDTTRESLENVYLAQSGPKHPLE